MIKHLSFTRNLRIAVAVSVLLSAAFSGIVAFHNAPARAQGPALSIMPLGDSLTQGGEDLSGTFKHYSYRGSLQTLLTAGGYTYNFVGTTGSISAGATDIDHEGHSGHTIGGVDPQFDGANKRMGLLDNIDEYFAARPANEPDVVLLMAGINDVFFKRVTTAPASTRLTTLVQTIQTKRPNAKILVASLAQTPGQATEDNDSAAIRAQIASTAQSLGNASATDNVFFVDMASVALLPADFAPDGSGVHLSASGAQKIAQKWYHALVAAGGPLSTPTATPVMPTATRTPTLIPATATFTPAAPTATRTPTPVAPTATRTPTAIPATITQTPVAPTATRTPTAIPATITQTPIVPTATRTPTAIPATITQTPVAPTATRTPTAIPATITQTPIVPTATRTPTAIPATITQTPVAPTATRTPTAIPATITQTPVAPTATRTPSPATATLVPNGVTLRVRSIDSFGAPIAGLTARIDVYNTGNQLTQVGDAAGLSVFAGLPVGSFRICVLKPGNRTNTRPGTDDGAGNPCYWYSFGANTDFTAEFEWSGVIGGPTSTPQPTATSAPPTSTPTPVPGGAAFAASVWSDANGNGNRDNGETALVGWRVTAFNQANNDAIGATGLTDANGAVTLGGLPSGSYRVCLELQSGWAATRPTSLDSAGRACYWFSITVGATQPLQYGARNTGPIATATPTRTPTVAATATSGPSPTATRTSVATATATATAAPTATTTPAPGNTVRFNLLKFEDINGNGAQDGGDAGLSGWTIVVVNSGTGVSVEAVTNASGTATVNVAPGNYRICEINQTGWTNTRPNVVDELGRPCYWLTMSANTQTTLSFGNTRGALARAAGTADVPIEIVIEPQGEVVLNSKVFLPLTRR